MANRRFKSGSWIVKTYIEWKKTNPDDDVTHVNYLDIYPLNDEELSYANDLLMNDLSKFTQLVQLNIKYIPLITLPNSITNLVKLDSLQLKNTGIESLPNNIDNLKNLVSLEITNSNINSLPASFGNLKQLSYLTINKSKLDHFPDVILNCTNLEHLELSNNPFNTIPDGIGNLTELFYLDLSDTQIDSLPESIGNLQNLETFSINNTNITSLPERFNDLQNLDKLHLTNVYLKSVSENMYGLQPDVIKEIDHALNIKRFENIQNDKAQLSFDFSTAAPTITDLNRRIASKCNNLSIQLGDRTVFTGIDLYDEQQSLDPNQVNLCLYYNQRCISSIVYSSRYVNGHGWGLEIMSTTDAKHANNKYNVLLRGVSVLVASQLIDPYTGKPMSYVISRAINPISVWVFVKHFNAIIIKPDTFPFMEETMTQPEIAQYFKSNKGVMVYTLIQLTKENIDNADQIISKLLSTVEPTGFKCPPSEQGGYRSRQRRSSRKPYKRSRKSCKKRATRKLI
jgi:hypothetical protein